MSMTIAEVRKALKHADESLEVVYDFGHLYPTPVDSWRGIYAEPALGWADDRNLPVPTVADILADLDLAVSGKLYDGYKGGQYTYKDSDVLHIDNYGDCSNTEIDSIEVTDYSVTIRTRKE